MTGLEVVKADYIKVSNLILDERPWVCTQMRILSLAFLLSNYSTGTQLTLTRIGILTRLKSLDFMFTPV